ncbi:diguanylate cyclase [Peptostreptococcaceae bacterium AGR-M142]
MFNTLRGKLIINSISLLAIVIITLTILFYTYEYNNLVEIAFDRSLEVNKLQAEYLGRDLDIHMKQLIFISENEKVKELDMPIIMNNLTNLINNENFHFHNSFFINENGYFKTPSGETGFSSSPDYKKLKNKEVNYIITQPLIGIARSTPSIVFACTIPSKDKFVGALGGSLKLNELTQMISNNIVFENSYGFIFNSQGLVVAHPEPKHSMTSNMKDLESIGYIGINDIWVASQNKKSGYGEYYDSFLDEEKILTYYEIPNSPGWKLAITTFKDDIYQPIKRLKLQLINISIIVTMATIVLAWIYSNRLIKPLLKLTKTVENSKENNILLIDEKYSLYEIDLLIEAYNKMGKSLSEYTHKLEDKVQERTEELNRINKILNERNKLLENKNTQLYTLATTDKLTGLLNRAHINDLIKKTIESVKLGESISFSILFLDLDNFKYYNDTFGHDIGDEILIYISNLFKSSLRSTDVIGRYGGDEFVIILKDSSYTISQTVASKLEQEIKKLDGYKEKLKASLNIDDLTIPKNKILGISVGIEYYDKNSNMDLDEMIKQADIKMYKIKKEKKNDNLNQEDFYE